MLVKKILCLAIAAMIVVSASAAIAGAKEDFLAGFAAFKSGDVDTALFMANQILQRPNINAKGKAVAYTLRGMCYAKQKRIDAAIDDLNRAIDLNPNIPQAYKQRASIWLSRREPQKAYEDSTKAINLKPDFYSVYGLRGLALQQLKQIDLALKDFST